MTRPRTPVTAEQRGSARRNGTATRGDTADVQRAAVLVGVSRTGGLPALQAVSPGIEQMAEWTRAQGFTTLTTLTDDAGPVTAAQIQQAIGAVLASGTCEQLVVYFAGHGVNIGRAEYWLLSGAPTWANEAVNVDASERLARYCGVGHVVLISDCCRTAAAADTVYQSITGTAVFPNEPPIAAKRPVDRFYACALGSPALEVRPEGADGYTAVYTATLVEALGGSPDSLLDRTDDAGVPVGLVRPWPLDRHLTGEVSRRLLELTGSFDHSQVPESIITSGPEAWLSRFERPGRPGPPPAPGGPTTPALVPEPGALQAALDDADTAAEEVVPRPARGTRAVAHGTTVVVDGPAATADGEVDPGSRPATDLLLRFGNGTCAVVPALRRYTVTATLDGRELVDLTWSDPRGAGTGRLGVVVNTAARMGTLRPAPGEAEGLAERLRYGPAEPALTLHAAYALADLHRDDLVVALADRLAAALGVELFDLALLAGRVHAPAAPLAPAVPLLARGWALHSAPSEEVAVLRRHLLPSVWTLFDEAAAPLARTVLSSTGSDR